MMNCSHSAYNQLNSVGELLQKQKTRFIQNIKIWITPQYRNSIILSDQITMLYKN